MRLLVSVALLVSGAMLWPSPATAQTAQEQQLPAPDPNAPPAPTPVPASEPRLFTREQAETLLAEASGAQHFDIVMSEQGAATLQHCISGMVCRFPADGSFGVTVSNPADERSNVGCTHGPNPHMIYAAWSGRINLDTAMQGTVGYFRRHHPDARAFTPSGDLWPSSSRAQQFAHLVSQGDGETSVFHAAVIRNNRWTLIYTTEYRFNSSGGGPGDLVGIAMELASAAGLAAFLSDLD